MKLEFGILSLALIVSVSIIGCGVTDSPDTGACITGSGVTSVCRDDLTSDQCSYIGGSDPEWNEGESCSTLGYGYAADPSTSLNEKEAELSGARYYKSEEEALSASESSSPETHE